MRRSINAMTESFVDPFKTELIRDRVFKTRTQLELAIVEYVAWFNNDRLHESLDDIAPAEFEALCESVRFIFLPQSMKRANHQTRSPRNSEDSVGRAVWV
jgi:hypothetical protein